MRRLVVFAHYDAQGEVKPYVVHYLRALREHCDRLAFVSTAELGNGQTGLDGLCDEVVVRDNVGFDFAMWQHVIARTAIDELDELVLTNSSIFGPLRPLGPAFAAMARDSCDFWGITDNYEFKWHLQSYFLVFKKTALASEAFERFWGAILPYRDKWQTILSYELGLTQFLTEAGLVGRALVACDSLFPDGPIGYLFRHRRRNPTCFHPVRTLRHGSPFVKVELLRDNPASVRLVPVYREIARTDYPTRLISFDRPVRSGGLEPPHWVL
jgi:lipopolysaccharide biosynthesis protein